MNSMYWKKNIVQWKIKTGLTSVQKDLNMQISAIQRSFDENSYKP